MVHGWRLFARHGPRGAWVGRRCDQLRPSCHRFWRNEKDQAPILGNFGGQDRGIPPEDVKKFQQAMEKLGKKIDVKIYPDAGHGFENPNNKTGYKPEDAADAWQRTVVFLAANLKK
jgi:dienelactone hydrolase